MSGGHRFTGALLASVLGVSGSHLIASEIEATDLAYLTADVVLLGELHDNPDHHLNQATAVAVMQPRGLVFEMFGPAEALLVTQELRVDPTALAIALRWDENGWPDFAMYHPIFLAAAEATVFGGALPRDAAKQAVVDGAAAILGDAAVVFGVDQALGEDELTLRVEGQRKNHCDALPEDVLPGLVEAQRVRDAAIARAIIAALAETGGPVAVITGNGHARTDWGVPRMLERAMPDLDIVSVAQFEAPPDDAEAPFDLWIISPPAVRDDPCDVFRR